MASVVMLLFAWIAIMFQAPSASAQTAACTTHSATVYDPAIQYASAQGADLTAATPAASRAGVVTLSASAPCREVFVAADSGGMAGVRAAGQTGEDLAGIVKNTDHIPSASGTAAYRIPDELNASTLGEVKNVSSLSYTNQLRDFQAYAQSTGRTFNLYVRGSTSFSGPLQDAINAGQINVIRNLPG